MFDIVTVLFLAAGALLAGDLILIASRGPAKAKPDWKTAVLAGAAGMASSELLSLVSWQLTAWSVPVIGQAWAGWANAFAASLLASFVSARIIRRKFGLNLSVSYLCSAAGLVPAFILYSLLLGVFAGFFAAAR